MDDDKEWLEDTSKKLDRVLSELEEGYSLQLTIASGDAEVKGSLTNGGEGHRIRALCEQYEYDWHVRCSYSVSLYYLTFQKKRTFWDHLLEPDPVV